MSTTTTRPNQPIPSRNPEKNLPSNQPMNSEPDESQPDSLNSSTSSTPSPTSPSSAGDSAEPSSGNAPEQVQTLLKQKFGWNAFKPGQQAVIEKLLAGESALAVFPTGGGKSLCYQLPALVLEGLTVVVSPLIALMKDQIDQLQQRGVHAVRLDSSLTLEEYRSAMDDIRSGRARILYTAPERFFNERFRHAIEGIRISLFAIDEAHCISQWGHNFRPDYLKLARIARDLQSERVLGLTATATPAVQEDIATAFRLPPENVVCTPFFRPNLAIRSRLVDRQTRFEELSQSLDSRDSGPTIIYVTLQKTAETVSKKLSEQGRAARAYHAGMKAEERNEIQEWFMNSDDGIVVATIAFGMGIDKSNIRYVYHFNPSKSLESFAQEIGRAGRDGRPSVCETFLVPDDRTVLENFVYGDTPSLPSIQKMVTILSGQPSEFFISQYQLSFECDIKKIVLQTMLTYLELDGYLEGTGSRFDSYEFKPLVPSAKILAAFEGDRADFVRGLLACSQKKSVWFSIDIPAAMHKLNSDRGRIVRAFDYFAEQGWLELKVSGSVQGYRKLRDIPAELASEYYERSLEREMSGIQRLDELFELLNANACQAAMLSEHFGQPVEQPCGDCTFCTQQGAFEIPSPPSFSLTDTTRELVKSLRAKHPEALNTARAAARFLCGLTSPKLTRTKLSRHKEFGSHSDHPFGEIMEQLQVDFP